LVEGRRGPDPTKAFLSVDSILSSPRQRLRALLWQLREIAVGPDEEAQRLLSSSEGIVIAKPEFVEQNPRVRVEVRISIHPATSSTQTGAQL